ncbi:hypothetical protein [Novosphingobium naphthalenivorans]|uniref:hypothetical protein n=1 Tax=Novosphingobium naphthalenivorans TaxID=273168 RepID=UPI000832D43C|nr:hypothetical protein [Novosphingobium naphthalenivorans]
MIAIPDARANGTPIIADVRAPWEHDQTGYVFPPVVTGFERTSIQDFGKGEFDLSAAYSDPATHTETTLYLFHAGLADPSVWHDRILVAMSSGALGTLGDTTTTVFTPPTRQAGAGIRSVAPLEGKSSKATGVAIYPFADWLIAVRMTSRTLEPSALDARLAAFVQDLSAPAVPTKSAPPAYLIAPCEDALPEKQAKIFRPTMMDAMIGAAADLPNKDLPYDEAALAPMGVVWCRDSASTNDYGVYRADGTKKRYIVAVGDAGMTAFVGADKLGAQLSGAANMYQMLVRTVDHTYVYPRFSRLPAVNQVIGQISRGSPISSATRGKTDKTITLPSPSEGKEAH